MTRLLSPYGQTVSAITVKAANDAMLDHLTWMKSVAREWDHKRDINTVRAERDNQCK